MNENDEKPVMLGFQAEPKLRDELDLYAHEIERSRSWVIRRAVEEYLYGK